MVYWFTGLLEANIGYYSGATASAQ